MTAAQAYANPGLTTSRIRRARELAGLTIGQAARRIGWTVVDVSSFETGSATPSEIQLRMFADLYGVNLAWLQGADPVVAPATRALICGADISWAERDGLLELFGAIATGGEAG